MKSPGEASAASRRARRSTLVSRPLRAGSAGTVMQPSQQNPNSATWSRRGKRGSPVKTGNRHREEREQIPGLLAWPQTNERLQNLLGRQQGDRSKQSQVLSSNFAGHRGAPAGFAPRAAHPPAIIAKATNAINRNTF